MAMARDRKEQEVKDLHERFSNTEIMVVAHNLGLTVAEMTEYRSELRKEGANAKVTKNTLARLALKDTKFEHVADLFKGPTFVATSQDPVAAAKVTQKFAKNNKNMVIIGGALGEVSLDAAAIEQLAKLPSLDELRAKLVGLVQAPATKIAGVLQAPAGKLARVCGAYGASE